VIGFKPGDNMTTWVIGYVLEHVMFNGHEIVVVEDDNRFLHRFRVLQLAKAHEAAWWAYKLAYMAHTETRIPFTENEIARRHRGER
jgi:hypothetical protein